MKRLAPIAGLLLALCQGCSLGYRSGDVSGSAAYGGQISMRTDDRVLAGVIVTVVMAESVRYYLRGDDGSMTALRQLPPPDPRRRVNEQDCLSPVDPTLGNLRCR